MYSSDRTVLLKISSQTDCAMLRVMDVINCAKFYRNRLRGLDSMSGQSLIIPIGLRYRR